MTGPTGPAGPSRRLLVNGEALRVEVAPTRSGGGSKYEPQTALQARDVLLPQIQAAVHAVETMERRFRSDSELYIEARLLPNYIAASYFPTDLLSAIDAVPVGSRADQALYRTETRESPTGTRRLILAITDNGLNKLATIVQEGGRTRAEQAAFAEIRKLDQVAFPAVNNVILAHPSTESEKVTWEAVLHPRPGTDDDPNPLDVETLGKWFTLIASVGGEVYKDYIRVVGGLTFCPVSIDDRAATVVARFNPLRAIRPMPAIRPRPRFGLRNLTRAKPPITNVPVQPYPSVAVFDGGLDTPSAVISARSTTDLTSEPPKQDELDHGTGVIGAVVCGLATPGETVRQPPLPVDSYRVLPAPPIPGDLYGYWVLDQIKDAVVSDGHKIVNLSLGPTLAVEDSMEPNRWTAELDELAWEHQVLFVVAAGNDGEADRATGLHRIQVPADMANGLTVGACDIAAPATPWKRAPYSSMGPGRQGNRIQPLGVQFGGTESDMFPVLRADGSFLEACGTSFAAPLVTHALADLTTRLPHADPNILRAFSVHFADRHRTHRKLRDEVGYGRLPLTFEASLECSPSEVHVLYADEIERNVLLGYKLPIPDLSAPVKVRITLAYASPVDPTQPTEYTTASLNLVLRPHSRLFTFYPPRGQSGSNVVLDLSSTEAKALIASGWTMSQEPVSRSLLQPGNLSEQQLRDSGKWETLRHYRINFNSGDCFDPRLEISYVARRGGSLDSSPVTIPFALLVSVEDQEDKGDIYDTVVSQFAALRPVQQVAGRLRLRSSSADS